MSMMDITLPVAFCLISLFLNAIAAQVLSHQDMDGSPSFCIKGNAVAQLFLIAPCVGMGWISHPDWLNGPVDPSPSAWGHVALWLLLAICLKDVPWLIKYGNYLILLHHVACVGGIGLFVATAPPSGNMFVASCGILELGSMLSTVVNYYPESATIVTIFFFGMSFSNVAASLMVLWHVSLIDHSIWKGFLLIVGPVLVVLRQQASNAYWRNFQSTGNILKAPPEKQQ